MTKHALTKQTWRYKVRPIRVDGDTAFITLTRGQIAVIDATDVPLVEGWNWSAIPTRDGNKWYARKGRERLHQVIYPAPPGLITDHRDRDGLNCRRSNLRHATFAENTRNRGLGSANKSGFKGVSFRRDRSTWLAAIRFEGRLLKIGTFATAAEAARAYDANARSLFGKFAVLNFEAVA